ncbi:MAG: uroporphyrinogen decarboxylase family protein [Armatimonadota bacterium]
MKFNINIDYPLEKMELNRKRIEARGSFKYFDRTPVMFCVVPRYFAPIFGMTYGDLFSDVETQYYWQLQFMKYRMENIPEDIWGSPTVVVYPYFDNVVDPSAFGGEIGWSEHETPRAIPVIKSVEAMDAYPMPELYSGLWGKQTEWWLRMKELAKETNITFNGEPGNVDVSLLCPGGLSPHMIAVDLVGEDFYWWMIEYPEACHRFLDRITKSIMRAEENFRSIDTRARGGYGLAEDSAQILSPKLFKEFIVPYSTALYDKFGSTFKSGRGMHMCGNSTHLHESIVNDMHVSSFDIFGYLVPPKVAAEKLGGMMYLWGNINPMLMLNGTKEEVKAEAMEALKWMAPCGGFMLGDGANVCPGTPIENLAALTEAAEEYGLPQVTGEIDPKYLG